MTHWMRLIFKTKSFISLTTVVEVEMIQKDIEGIKLSRTNNAVFISD